MSDTEFKGEAGIGAETGRVDDAGLAIDAIDPGAEEAKPAESPGAGAARGGSFALSPTWRVGLAAGLLTGFALALAAAARARQDTPQPMRHVDLRRYAGRWFEIARLPNRFQRDCDRDVAVQYVLRADGRVAVENQCVRKDGSINRAKGVARPATRDGSNARLKVRFAPAPLGLLPMVWGDYWILDLAPDYAWAIIGHPNRELLWLLARTPSLPAPLYHELLRKAALKGYDTSLVVRTRQTGA